MHNTIPWEPRKQLFYILRTGLIIVSAVFLFNVVHQTTVYRTMLAARANLAVFIRPEASARAETIRQQIQAMPGINHVYLVTPEEALATALKDSPSLNDVMVTGINPFSAYFLVYPRTAVPAHAERIKEAIKKNPDIDEVRSDDRLFSMIETLDKLGALYRMALMVIAAGFVLLVCMRCIEKWLYEPTNIRRLIVTLTEGLIGGALGMGLTALLMHVGSAGLTPLPVVSLWLCLPAGLFLSLHED